MMLALEQARLNRFVYDRLDHRELLERSPTCSVLDQTVRSPMGPMLAGQLRQGMVPVQREEVVDTMANLPMVVLGHQIQHRKVPYVAKPFLREELIRTLAAAIANTNPTPCRGRAPCEVVRSSTGSPPTDPASRVSHG